MKHESKTSATNPRFTKISSFSQFSMNANGRLTMHKVDHRSTIINRVDTSSLDFPEQIGVFVIELENLLTYDLAQEKCAGFS